MGEGESANRIIELNYDKIELTYSPGHSTIITGLSVTTEKLTSWNEVQVTNGSTKMINTYASNDNTDNNAIIVRKKTSSQ